MLAAFRDVRNARNPHAHKLDDNVFDKSLFVDQRGLIERAYRAVRTLRVVLGQFPPLADYNGVPDWLREWQIAKM